MTGSRWVVALRWVLLVAAAGGVTAGVLLARRHDRGAMTTGAYVCPMHLGETAAAPGDCPICGMSLVERARLRRARSGPLTATDEIAAGTDGAAAMAPTPAEDEAGGGTADELLARAASGVAPNLLGYYPSPVRLHMLRYEIYAPAYVEPSGDELVAQVYADQLAVLEPAERAVFLPASRPNEKVPVQLAPAAATAWDRSTSLVRFRFAPDASRRSALRPAAGNVGWVRFSRQPRQMRVVPAGAVLQSAEGPYVLAVERTRDAAGGKRPQTAQAMRHETLHKRRIEIGRQQTGLAAVLSGLELREQVASVNAFFWDAQRRLGGDDNRLGGDDNRRADDARRSAAGIR